MSRFFITHIVPRDKVLQYNLSVAACNFSHNLIQGNGFDKVYSILPSFINGKVEEFDGLVYSSWRRKRLLKKFACFRENITLFFKIPRGASVWYYNCTLLNALLILMLRLLKPTVRQQMIILDYTPSNSLISKLMLWLTNHMDGTIKLADSPLFTVRNSVCLPGVIPPTNIEYSHVKKIRKEFLISGVLNDNISMLPMLLEAFSGMPDMTLHITGRAPDEDLVRRYTSRFENIHYYGIVEYEEYLRILHSTPFLLSTRNPKMPENQCNFPSKVIEALLHNRIIVSTIHYPQLEGIPYIEIGSDKVSFCRGIIEIFDKSEAELLEYANLGAEVQKAFNTDVWFQKIEEIERNEANL